MKILAVVVLFIATATQAKILEVPESCLVERKAPCLTQFEENQEIVRIKKIGFRVLKGSIIQWKSFEDVSLDILKGKVHVTDAPEAYRINEIFINKPQQLIERNEKSIFVLNLSNFNLSTYAVFEIQTNNVLAKTTFLEKAELLQFVARFFERRNQFSRFVKSIEQCWKTEFAKNTDTQTKVLKRAIASAAETQRLEKKEKLEMSEELKKVREQFFYRTFYR